MARLDDESAAGFTVACFDQEQDFLVSGDSKGSIALWDAGTLAVERRFQADAPIEAVALSPDGTTLASACTSSPLVTLWSRAGGQAIRTLNLHKGGVTAVLFRPNGQLVTAGLDKRVLIHDLNNDTVTKLQATAALAGVAINSRYALAWSGRRPTRSYLWDLKSGKVHIEYVNHTMPVSAGALPQSGQWAATASKDHTVHIWPTDPESIVRNMHLRELSATDRNQLDLRSSRLPVQTWEPPPVDTK